MIKKYQNGQALIELGIFISFIIAPLLLLTPYLAKLIEARHYNDMAARYIAWEKTVWLERNPSNWSSSSGTLNGLAIKQTSNIEKEIPYRFFSKTAIPINSRIDTGRKWSIEKDAYVSFKFNQAQQSNEQSLLAPYNPNAEKEQQYFNQVNTSNSATPGRVSRVLNRALDVISLGGSNFNTRGFFKGESNIQIASHLLIEDDDKTSEKSNEIGRETKRESEFEIKMRSQVYILADGWNVGGINHNARVVRGLLPSSAFDNGIMSTILDAVSVIPVGKKLDSNSLKFGHLDLNQIPTHRLREY